MPTRAAGRQQVLLKHLRPVRMVLALLSWMLGLYKQGVANADCT